MRYKPDWPEAEERLTALWREETLDRPCMAVRAPSGNSVPGPGEPQTAEQKWLDPEWVVPHILADLENTWWGGEAIPSGLLMGGWAVCLGGRPRFELATIWFEPFEVDFTEPSPFVLAPDDPWLRKYERLYLAAIEKAAWDDFLVGSPGGLPANDFLSMHMGTANFLLALVDEPEWMEEAILRGGRESVAARRQLQESARQRHRFWYGCAGWMPFWAPEPFLATQSDVSCMLSPEMFERFVVPELDLYGNEFGALWYHLDGGDARQHLPRLLSLPYMRVIQYVPRPCEPPNGEGHLDLYREIQEAGRIVHVQVGADQVEPLVRGLDPSLLMLQVTCGSVKEGEELLAAAKRWM